MSKRAKRKASQEDRQRRERAYEKRYRRTVEPQRKAAAVRAKYGRGGRPALVVVRSLETGEVVEVVEQWRLREARPDVTG